LNLLSASARPVELVLFTLGELFVQSLNLQREKPDEAYPAYLMITHKMFVRDLGATTLHVGEHLAADIHPDTLQACRHEFLAQPQFMAFLGQITAEDIQSFHNGSFHSNPGRNNPTKTAALMPLGENIRL
jgi:hypothetical protein